MWLRLYLPMFWFKAGLFTLMKMDSLMVLAFPWSSLPMMLKLVSVMLCPHCCMCAWMGEGCLRCSWHLSPRILAVSPIYSSFQAMWLHWKLQITPLFFSSGSWSFGFMQTCFIVVLPLKCTCTPYLPHVCLKLSDSPFVYGITTCPTVEMDLELMVVVVLVPWLLFACVWLLLFSPVCVCCSKLLVVAWVL